MSETDLADSKVLVTGGKGFLGHYVEREFTGKCKELVLLNSRDCNLIRRRKTEEFLREESPDVIIHLAGRVGGIGANRKYPGTYFYTNAMMGMNVINTAMQLGVKKLVVLGTVCSYPWQTKVPFQEKDLWEGYPEPTNAPYAIAKQALLTMCQAYREEFDLNAIYLMPTNLYGPREDDDLELSHVIPALVRKILEAKRDGKPTVELWGTGVATRDFLHAQDAARAIRLATEFYNEKDPVNVGSGTEVSIKELADAIKVMVGWEGVFTLDTTKPDGQFRRCLDTSRAKAFHFEPQVSLETGLQQTIDWYKRKM